VAPAFEELEMIRWTFSRLIDGFEKRYGYDATYMREILAASPSGFLKFSVAQVMNLHREQVAPAAWHAARIAAARHEDCGPCTQLVVNMALEAGIDAALVRAVVARDFARMSADAGLGVRLAEATLAHASTDELRAEVVRRYGERGLISLAYAIAVPRIYPTIKRVLGHAHTCERVTVEGDVVAAARATERRLAS
jgi:hypothetical protein